MDVEGTNSFFTTLQCACSFYEARPAGLTRYRVVISSSSCSGATLELTCTPNRFSLWRPPSGLPVIVYVAIVDPLFLYRLATAPERTAGASGTDHADETTLYRRLIGISPMSLSVKLTGLCSLFQAATRRYPYLGRLPAGCLRLIQDQSAYAEMLSCVYATPGIFRESLH